MLDRVLVTPEVWQACFHHALTTQTEEIMGLLIGEKSGSSEGTLILTAMKISRRITKQKDRVEIDHQDMIAASEFAEGLSGARRVLGWYHSHPRMTVHPSHVDLATQANYQLMDTDFVGLIFSVFNYDSTNNVDSKEAIAFQTDQGKCRNVRLELLTEDWSMDRERTVLEAVARIPDILMQEECDEHKKACEGLRDDLSLIYNQGCLMTQLSAQTSVITAPILESLVARKQYLKDDIKLLSQELEKLEREADRLSGANDVV